MPLGWQWTHELRTEDTVQEPKWLWPEATSQMRDANGYDGNMI